MTNTELTSKSVVAAFAAKGVKVRVRDLGKKFRICPVSGSFDLVAVSAIANELSLTNACGLPINRFAFNGATELAAYKPGAIVRGGETHGRGYAVEGAA